MIAAAIGGGLVIAIALAGTPAGDAEPEIVLVAANPARGWHWPFRVSVPAGTGPLRLLVVPNNTGKPSDDPAVHDAAAAAKLKQNRKVVKDLDVAMLIPSFPRPAREWRTYTHALDRDTMLARPPLGRLDEQLIAMIDAARGVLRERRRPLCERSFFIGFSASGQFVSRFALLHPEVVQAAVVASPGGWPMVPVATDGGETLNYPVGIADYPAIAGRPFPRDLVRRLPLLFVLGADDTNDAVAYRDAFDEPQAALVNRRFGTTLPARWTQARRLFAGFTADFRLYPGVGHTWAPPMIADALAFFRRHDDRAGCRP